MPRGANPKRGREYGEPEKELEREGRHEGREEEVAARMVDEQRARAKEKRRESPGRGLPIVGLEDLAVPDIVAQLDRLSHQELRSVEAYERGHKDRRTLLAQIARRIRH